MSAKAAVKHADAEVVPLVMADAGTQDGTRKVFFDADKLPLVHDEEVLPILPEDQRKLYAEKFSQGGVYCVIAATPDLWVARFIAPPGFNVPPHNHGANSLTYVLQGELHYEMEDGKKIAKPGMGLYAPTREKAEVVAGPEGCTFLEVYGPAPQGIFL